MKVKELILRLLELPQDQHVVVFTSDGCWCLVNHIDTQLAVVEGGQAFYVYNDDETVEPVVSLGVRRG